VSVHFTFPRKETIMRKTVQIASLLVAAAVLGGVATPTWAVDGVVLIDQNKALAGNVTPSDAPGFPVTITLPGSYRLSSNLIVPNADTTAIVIAANTPGVTIDLNGFSIIGPTVCTGFPLSCSPTGTGMGVATALNDPLESFGATVRNGTVRGMGSIGVALYTRLGTVENVTVLSNGGGGIFVELGTVVGNRVFKNGGDGIGGGNSVISRNMVSGNRDFGISVDDSIVLNNAMIVNGNLGLNASNTGFASNVFSSNNGGFLNPQFSGRSPIGPYICDGSVCP
jgi:hypothetical protein